MYKELSFQTWKDFTLPCGLRVIFEQRQSPVVYCGYVMCAGTRHEDNVDTGMAHFIEHMTFKGTEKRKARQITNGLERVGGNLNAYTTKQETVYYAIVLQHNFNLAVELLTDIVFHSTFPQNEIDKEVDVICDEIDSYKDSPSELIFDEFESMMYEGQPLGRDILGEAKRLHEYTTDDALRFTSRFYQPSNAIFYVYGNIDFNTLIRTLERLLPAKDFDPSLAPFSSLTPQPCSKANERIIDKKTHQAHVLIGGPTFSGKDKRIPSLILLNNILGGPGMNSRLNLSMREKAGLVYSVDSYLNTYPDTGFWNVYFGCDIDDIKRCRKLLERELLKFIEKPLSAAQLMAAKKQLIGQIGISTDSSEGYALAMGKTFAHYNRHRDILSIFNKIQQVSTYDIQNVAQEVYNPERLTTLIYL